MIRSVSLLALTALLAACAALTGPRREYAVYTLNPPAAAIRAPAPVSDWLLAIDAPHALGLLDSDRLVVAPDANERLAFAGMRWNERAPVLLQDVWLRAFEADGRLAGAIRHPAGSRATVVLASDLLAFQIEHGGAQAQAVVAVQVRLLESASRRVLAHARFSAREDVHGSDARAAVTALEAATGALTTQLVEWVVDRSLRDGAAP